jgi:adenosylcobinamide kinase/adenosylcobinamide-phosphate guanylyltransferase
MAQIILVTGPARSGKSEWAETLAQQYQRVIYIATAVLTPDDPEWSQRVSLHQQRRPQNWQTWEIPQALPKAIEIAKPPGCLLVDSLGTWIANLLEEDEQNWQKIQTEFITTLQLSPLTIILVAEETGWGVVPSYPLGRQFRDRLGTLVRELGQIATTTYLITAGHVLNLSQIATPLSPRSKDLGENSGKIHR